MIVACPNCKAIYEHDSKACPCGAPVFQVGPRRIPKLKAAGYVVYELVQIPPGADLAPFVQGSGGTVTGFGYACSENRRPAIKHLTFSNGIRLWLGSGAGEAAVFAASRPLEMP